MELPCDYFMYFPSAPVSSSSDLEDYASLPRRDHLYLGETVQFLLVLRFRKQPDGDDRHGPLEDLATSLSAQASACIAEGRCQGDPRSREDDEDDEDESGTRNRGAGGGGSGSPFRQCGVALIHSSAPDGRHDERLQVGPVEQAVIPGFPGNTLVHAFMWVSHTSWPRLAAKTT